MNKGIFFLSEEYLYSSLNISGKKDSYTTLIKCIVLHLSF